MVSRSNRSFLLLLMLPLAATAAGDGHICISPSRVFTVIVDLFSSELGYFRFKECGDMVNPTIGLELGETYIFNQGDRSNFYHPLGFAYFPDGAHAGVEELEPSISLTDSDCADDFSCPTPRYFKNGAFLGEDSTGNFGLDDYEPEFFRSPDWYADSYVVELNFDEESYDKDIFYFCHIHQYMSGRIKLLKDNYPVSMKDDPPLGYEYDPSPGDFDKACGTFGLEDFQTGNNPICPDRFVCGSDSTDISKFSRCIDAMNCHMLDGMTTGVSTNDAVTLFIHQMIPHHQNAVNMAKTLLIENVLSCDDLSDDEDQQCIIEQVLREIINGQNHQIQKMLGYLDSFNLPETDNCVVEINTVSTIIEGPADYDRDNGIIAGLAVAPEQLPASTTSDAAVSHAMAPIVITAGLFLFSVLAA